MGADSVGPLPPGKTLRKTISIGAFPQPPKSRGGSHPPSPLSAFSTPNGDSLDQRLSAGSKIAPSRENSLRRTGPRASLGGRGLLGKPPLTPPSLLNGSGESVAVAANGHLSLPSPPQSRNSSAQGSYATSTTTFEDVGEDELRGRSDNNVGGEKQPATKDGKGNVIVSVRIRPNIGSSADGEWEVNNKRALISYKGREGGDYYYGRSHNFVPNGQLVADCR